MGAFDDLIPGYFQPDLAQGRARFQGELADPNVYSALNQRIANEVGSQSPDEQQAFVESVFNRANARGLNLGYVVNDPTYFPRQSFRSAGNVDYTPVISRALQGSNVANYATGNESGNVHSGGAPVTMVGQGGERFVVENKDIPGAFDDLIPARQNGSAGAFDDLIPKKDATPAQPASETSNLTPPTDTPPGGGLSDKQLAQLPDMIKRMQVQEQVGRTSNVSQSPSLPPGMGITDVDLSNRISGVHRQEELDPAGYGFSNEKLPEQQPLPDEYDQLFYKTGKTKSEREALNKPLREAMQVPALSPEDVTKAFQTVAAIDPGSMGTPQGPVEKASTGELAKAISGMTSGEGAASIPLYAFPPTAAALAGEQVQELPSQVSETIKKYQAGDYPGAAAAGTQATMNALMIAAMAHGGAEAMGSGEMATPRFTPESTVADIATQAKESLIETAKAMFGKQKPWEPDLPAKPVADMIRQQQEPTLAQKIQQPVAAPEAASPAAAAPETAVPQGQAEATVPVMITRQMEADLRTQGYSQAAINKMTPQEANDILSQAAKPAAAEPGAGYKADVTHYSPDPARQFTSDRPAYFHPAETADFSNLAGETKGKIIRGSVELRNPITLPAEETVDLSAARIKELRDKGHDGVVADDNSEVIVFDPKKQFSEVSRQSPSEPEAKPAAAEPQPITAELPTEPIAAPQAVSDQPHVSAVANRFTAERAASGELGEIAPGEGVSTQDLVQRGLKMPPERAAEAVSRMMQGGDVPIDDAAAIRGEEARLSQRSNELSRAAQANPADVNARLEADNAFKDLTDFHNGPVAQLKRNFHAQGMALQGEIPVDLSTLNGLREAWLKDTGKPPPPEAEPMLRRTADKVARSVADEKASGARLGEEVDKATRGRKLPTADEVRQNIAERMGVEPCPV